MKLPALIIMGLFTLGNSLSAQKAERNKKILQEQSKQLR